MQTKILYRFASLLILISIVISSNLVAYAAASPEPAPAVTSFTFAPVADAYVIQSTPDSNFGASASLRVDNTPLTRSYLRFEVNGLNGSTIQSAKLRIYANSTNNSGYSVAAVSDNNWAEETITFNNSPVLENNINNSQPITGGAWTEVDISGYVQVEGPYSLALTIPSDTNTNLASREAAATAPQLVITSLFQETATPTSTTVPTLVSTDLPTSTSVPLPTATNQAGPDDWQPSFPIRAAFYYPWFPESWTQSGIYPFTNYTPSLGYYSAADQNLVRQHIGMMQYGNIQAGISSWWGQGHHTDTKVAGLLSAATGTNFRWSLYYENESLGDPSVSQIQSDLTYIRDNYGNDPSFLRVGGKFVVFVYSDTNDACGMADRWKQANTVGAYIVLKVFPGYAACANQPDSWHQYSPAVAADQQGTISYAISPGFWLKGQPVRLARDLARWTQNVKDMAASGANWQLVTTFNEWGEGTIVEPAAEWACASGYGQYLDALHFNGNIPAPTQTSAPQPTATQTSVPQPTATKTAIPLPTSTSTQPPAQTATSTPGQSQSLTFTPSADAYVNAASAGTNYGGLTSLRVDASPVVKSYLRFTVAGLGGQAISQARLLIYANSSSTQGLVIQTVENNTWGEMTLNSTNAPALGSTLTASTSVSGGTWITLDVTSYVKGEGTFSFGVSTPGSTAISLASRESGANSPKLIVSVNGLSTPVATSTLTSVLTSTPTSTQPASGTNNILLLAGDICKHNLGSTDYTANCKKTGDLVRGVLTANPGAQVQTLGDNINNDGSASAYDAEYTDLYAPNWGSFLNATHVLMGNHDTYPPSGTTPYFTYFGAQAGSKPGGYYSYNIGVNWHVIALNAQCSQAGGCGVGSSQYNWLKNDLSANTRKCVLAVWHQPRWTSGRHTDDALSAAWWDLLYQYKVDIVANGHNHNYERFNLINPQQQAAADGIREFIVGTGGAPGDGYSYASHPLDPNEAIRNQSIVYGVLKLTLSDNSYTWDYLPASGYSFTDSGTTACH